MYKILGHHHISMMTKNGDENTYFYEEILGLRRVKVSVNQNNPQMYHLFYGDKTGSPGIDLTFFENQRLGHTQRGTNAISRIGLLVKSEENFAYWIERFKEYSVEHSEVTTYGKRPAILFEDQEGLRLALIAGEGQQADFWESWENSEVPVEHQIRGMGAVEFTVENLPTSRDVLVDIFGYYEVYRTKEEALYQSFEGSLVGEILLKEEKGPKEKPGKGSVHHLAIRVSNGAELDYWQKKITDFGFKVVGRYDRYYFESMYFREANGIMIEIATDKPGFTIDSDVESLGKQLDLPPFLNEKRDEIFAKLNPLKGIKE
ncbi:VOC family protein [Jeotgalibaca ciconiae]|uniref:Ring-cleaving dioxygenase n=1 Tax=Jeotgalibaca ciconiae TaxID=2496265 RepID=A0A3S9H8X1_9LACT|nr:VOC family protein [Jeotgalibaca ciconiae]AZP03794.1 ring-cleaving dioxygenase [Jeotgalibaca ciconiae]